MGKFNAAKIFIAIDNALMQAHNKLCDLLDTGYNVKGKVGGKDVEVTVSPEKPFELKIDDRKYIYINPSTGVLVPSIYDVNEDGYVDQTDIELIQNYILTGTGYLPRMDVNGDGVVNSADITAIIRGGGLKAMSIDNTNETLSVDARITTVNDGTISYDINNHNGFAWAEYSYVSDGGAISTIVPTAAFNTKIPANSIIVGGTIHVDSNVTSGGSATVAIGLNGTGGATNSIMNATAIASLTANTIINSKTTFAAPIKVTSESDITFTIATATLTGGKIQVFLQYFILD